jgi:hypothetical protein
VRGEVDGRLLVNRGLCYCRDCQAFAHFLGRADEILHPRGGTDVVQVPPRAVTLTTGTKNLACMRLTDKGLLRWYASCCRTPLGNTLPHYRFSIVGLVDTCLRSAGAPALDESFGPVQMAINTKSSQGSPRPAEYGLFGGILRIVGSVAGAQVGGKYRQTPFYDAGTGEPVVEPHVLTRTEHDAVEAAVRG